MKLILLLAVVCGALATPTDYYITANDEPAYMESVVNDTDKLKAVTDCFLDRGDCDPIAMSYKPLIPESMATACQRCNDKQKHIANVYLRGVLAKIPEEHANFIKKFDPEGKYLLKFTEAVKDY